MHKKILSSLIIFLFSADIFADNYSLSFDGNDDVYLGNNSSLNIRNNTTVMAWVKPNTYSGRQEIMTNDDVWYWEIRSNGNLNFERHGGSQVNCNNCLTHNEWQHIAIIRDGSNLHMYINAQEVASSGINGTFNNISYGYYIGQHGHDNTLQYSGEIDEVSVWNTALTQTEIQSYMTTSPTGSEFGLVGSWNFNEGSGTTLTDQTSNENEGIINGATWSNDVPQNAAPTATAQSVTGNEDSPQTITLAGSDADGDVLTYALATDPSNGTSTLSGNVVTYTPNTNYNGSDSFTFTASDGELTSDAATVNISITAVNDTPVASAQSASGNEDAAQTITLTGTDPDGDALAYTLGTNPSNGTVNQDYSSVLNFDGANDYVDVGDMLSQGAYTKIAWVKRESGVKNNNIVSGNTGHALWAPSGYSYKLSAGHNGAWNTVQDIEALTIGEWNFVAVTYNPDVASGTMKLYKNGTQIDNATGIAVQNESTTTYVGRYGGGNNWIGSIDEVAIWNEALTAAEITALYNSGNELNADANYGNYSSTSNLVGYWKMNEGTGSSAIDHSGNGNDGTINGAGWITQGTPDVITYTPNANYNGSDSFTFTVSDGELTSDPAIVNITVTAVNDVPVIASTPALDALDGSLYEYSLSVNDEDGDDVAITATAKPDWLTVSNSNSNSLSFDGSNDYVSMPDMVAPSGNAPRTFMAWIKRNNTSTSWPGRAIGGWGNDAGNELMNIMILDDVLYWHVNGGNSLTGSTQINPDTWYHITATYDGTTQRFYVDGILDGSNNWNVNTGSGNVKFGKQPDWPGAYFDGFIDVGAIWSDALTVEEITAIYNSGNPLDLPDNLQGYWNFNEGSGTTVNDLSSNDNDGTINGASWSTDVPSSSYVLSGTPVSSDGGLHDIILSANDGNGGVVTQSYTVAVSLHSLEITGESGFRIMSSPVSGTIYGDLLEELWTQGAEGSDNSNSNPNIWTYGNGWNPVTDFASDSLAAGQGFLIYVFADTDFDGEDDLPVTISIDGAQQQSATTVVSEPSDWNLIGNPYGLPVDISQMLTDNNTRFNSTVYSLDRTNPGYRTHNGTVGNIQGDEIKPFDGFWIQADTDGDVFEFTEQSIRRGHINSNSNGRTTTDESSGSAVFTFTNGGYSSSTYLSFTAEGQINLDQADANRLVPLSPAEHLTSMIYESNKSLSINNLPYDLSTDISFPMDVMMLSPTDDGYATQAEQVDLTWDITNLPEGITLMLRNNITGQNINLTGYPSANINLSSKGSFSTSEDFMATYPTVGQSQFTLSVYGTLVAIEDDDIIPERLTVHSAYPNPFNPSTIISFDLPDADMVSLDIFDIAGRQVASLISEYIIPGSHQISWNPGNLSSGVYLVNLVIGTETFNQKITFIK